MKKRMLIAYLISGACMLSACSGFSGNFDNGEFLGEKTDAYLLKIDGQSVAYINTKEELDSFKENLIKRKTEEIKEIYPDIVSVSLNNTFDLEETECSASDIIPHEDIEKSYLDGGREFSFSVTVKESQIKTVAFKTVYQNSSSYYEGTSVVKTEGKNGESTLVYEITYTDGQEIKRTLVSETETRSAQNKVVLVGTKKSTASTGVYRWPLKSVYVTSSYGGRTLNGKYDFHLGVDLRAATGTYVYAADGGKVIFAGWNGSYGYLVKIEHDNGDLTYYAHLNKMTVKSGARVYKGQHIANSGATGNVTGPHLHFELRKNGSTVNPQSYLPK